MSWADGEAGPRQVRYQLVDDLDAEETEFLYFTLINADGAHLKRAQPLITVQIEDNGDNETLALTQRIESMPFVNSILDLGVRDRLLTLFHSYPTTAGQVVFQAGTVPEYLFVVDSGSFQLNAEGTRFQKGRTIEPSAGQIIAFKSTTARTPSPMTFVSKTSGHLWAIRAKDLQALFEISERACAN